MPQGGSGNQGGNLFSSGSSKKKMSQKKMTTSTRKNAKAAVAEGEAAGAAGPAFTVHAPDLERRADWLRAQEEGLARRRSLLVFGTQPGGTVLGGTGTSDSVSEQEARHARLQYLERQNTPASTVAAVARRKHQASVAKEHRRHNEHHHQDELVQDELALQQAARAVAQLPEVHRRRQGLDNGRDAFSSPDQMGPAQLPASNEASVLPASDAPPVVPASDEACVVHVLLNMLGERLGSESVFRCHDLLLRVLTNAAEKGQADPKYLRLKASNNTLWTQLLLHPEA